MCCYGMTTRYTSRMGIVTHNCVTAAAAHRITDDEIAELDSYARRGVIIPRDAASMVIAALRRDSYEMRSRGGDANNRAADQQDALAKAINTALCES